MRSVEKGLPIIATDCLSYNKLELKNRGIPLNPNFMYFDDKFMFSGFFVDLKNAANRGLLRINIYLARPREMTNWNH